jgi:hypothetical protein
MSCANRKDTDKLKLIKKVQTRSVSLAFAIGIFRRDQRTLGPGLSIVLACLDQ